jgi:hypothetical protein
MATMTLVMFSWETGGLWTQGDKVLIGGIIVRENGIFEPFIYKNEDFAKTGSGQT